MSVAQDTSVADFLKTVPIFAESAQDQFEQLAEHCVEEHYKPGELILEQGRSSSAYYFLRSGRVAAKVERLEGRETVATLDPPTVFGELSCITGEPCSADIEAMYDSEVLSLSKESLDAVGRLHPGILLGMVNLLAKRLHTTVVQGARAADKPVVVLREHPNFQASAAFSEELTFSLARQINKQALLIKIGTA